MKHMFSEVPKVAIPRSRFDRSHGYKTTFDAGKLIPFFIDEALPGDTFSVRMAAFARLATPIYPVMYNMRLETFFFAVPYRLVWDNWAKFCGERKAPTDHTDYLIPQVPVQNAAEESIWDYLGMPTGLTTAYNVNAIPMRAINLIWNEWFRDQNLQNPKQVETDDGPDAMNQYTLLPRGKRHDYFTSCLPWLQKGDAVQLSLGESAPVKGIGKSTQQYDGSPADVYESGTFTGTVHYGNRSTLDHSTADGNWVIRNDPDHSLFPGIWADLSAATASTVNELRQAIQVQRILEKDARAGTRYTEIVQSHFGVISPDARLQRPEYLGGGSAPVNISPVAKTFTNDTADQFTGQLAGFGTVGFNNHGFTKSFTEHCVIIGFLNVRADLTYQQGLDKMWSRRTRFEFYWPTLAHLGEQAVLNQEIFLSDANIADGTHQDAFGYQERYAEYRFKPSKITGKFRSSAAESLDAWHLSQEFLNMPVLSDIFIQEMPPIDRVIAVPSEPHFIFDSFIQMSCVRPMPVYSVPGLIDHF